MNTFVNGTVIRNEECCNCQKKTEMLAQFGVASIIAILFTIVAGIVSHVLRTSRTGVPTRSRHSDGSVSYSSNSSGEWVRAASLRQRAGLEWCRGESPMTRIRRSIERAEPRLAPLVRPTSRPAVRRVTRAVRHVTQFKQKSRRRTLASTSATRAASTSVSSTKPPTLSVRNEAASSSTGEAQSSISKPTKPTTRAVENIRGPIRPATYAFGVAPRSARRTGPRITAVENVPGPSQLKTFAVVASRSTRRTGPRIRYMRGRAALRALKRTRCSQLSVKRRTSESSFAKRVRCTPVSQEGGITTSITSSNSTISSILSKADEVASRSFSPSEPKTQEEE